MNKQELLKQIKEWERKRDELDDLIDEAYKQLDESNEEAA